MAQITIIGLDTIGMSLGLALRKSEPPITVVGVDRDGAAARRAQQLGAVERTELWAGNACKNSSLVILTEPISRLRDMLEAIANSLPQGCVVTCTSPLMIPVLAWAEQLLPEGVSFVAGHPILNPTKPATEPSAELFRQTQFCIVPSARATSAAMDLVSGLAATIGARPFFVDAAEHDGLITAVESLSSVLGTLLMSAATEASSWRDMRRLAGPSFAQATATAETDPAEVTAAMRANRENLARWLETFRAKLSDARDALAAEDDKPLTKLLADAREAREQWLLNSRDGNWDGIVEPPTVTMGELLGKMVWPQRRPPDNKQQKR